MATVSGDDDGGRRLSFWSEVGDRGPGTATEVQEKIPVFDRFSSSSSRSWFRRKSVLRFALTETEVRRKSCSWLLVLRFCNSVIRLAICNLVFNISTCGFCLVHGFLLFRESLKGDFSGFFGSVENRDSIFCLLPSRRVISGNSAELTEYNRFILSSIDSKHTDVSGVGIDLVRTEAVTTRPSRIGLGRFFEPCT